MLPLQILHMWGWLLNWPRAESKDGEESVNENLSCFELSCGAPEACTLVISLMGPLPLKLDHCPG